MFSVNIFRSQVRVADPVSFCTGSRSNFKTNVVVVLFYNYAFISVLIGKLIGRRCPLTDITNVGNKKLVGTRIIMQFISAYGIW